MLAILHLIAVLTLGSATVFIIPIIRRAVRVVPHESERLEIWHRFYSLFGILVVGAFVLGVLTHPVGWRFADEIPSFGLWLGALGGLIALLAFLLPYRRLSRAMKNRDDRTARTMITAMRHTVTLGGVMLLVYAASIIASLSAFAL